MTEEEKNSTEPKVEPETPEETPAETPAVDEETPEETIARLNGEIEKKNELLGTAERARKEQASNFKLLRDMSKEDKAKLSAGDLEIRAKTEEIVKIQQKQKEQARNNVIDKLANGDGELRKKIVFNYDRINDEADTEEEINNKALSAYNMLGINNSPNSITSAMNIQGKGQPTSDPADEKETMTDERKEELNKMFGIKLPENKDNK